MKQKKYRGIRKEKLLQGSVTVEAAFLVPMAVLLTVLLLFYCFCEHARVWYTAAACETALVGTAHRKAGEDPEQLAAVRGQSRIEENPFPMTAPSFQLAAENTGIRVSYQSAEESGMAEYFPYRTEVSLAKTDPVGGVRTAWTAKKIINGG